MGLFFPFQLYASMPKTKLAAALCFVVGCRSYKPDPQAA
jgi:hypothetical protein